MEAARQHQGRPPGKAPTHPLLAPRPWHLPSVTSRVTLFQLQLGVPRLHLF